MSRPALYLLAAWVAGVGAAVEAGRFWLLAGAAVALVLLAAGRWVREAARQEAIAGLGFANPAQADQLARLAEGLTREAGEQARRRVPVDDADEPREEPRP